MSYWVYFILFIAGLTVRNIYEALKKNGRIIPHRKAPLVIVVAAMCVLWISWFAMCPADPVKIPLPAFINWLGLGLVVLGTGLVLGALFQLKGVENINHLVTTGLFAFIRHPMYIGFIFWIAGWVLYHSALLSSLAGLLGVAGILSWTRREDEVLESQYGEAYRRYRRKTRF